MKLTKIVINKGKSQIGKCDSSDEAKELIEKDKISNKDKSTGYSITEYQIDHFGNNLYEVNIQYATYIDKKHGFYPGGDTPSFLITEENIKFLSEEILNNKKQD